ncbi:hypothetical protein Dip518_000663 [Parelusimicrobium proximum]|uniref:hypothetical protein n=1 Tax=Parelusimicrobium proximum TaxID=3228953 RepID=UPI003D169E22
MKKILLFLLCVTLFSGLFAQENKKMQSVLITTKNIKKEMRYNGLIILIFGNGEKEIEAEEFYLSAAKALNSKKLNIKVRHILKEDKKLTGLFAEPLKDSKDPQILVLRTYADTTPETAPYEVKENISGSLVKKDAAAKLREIIQSTPTGPSAATITKESN